MKKLNKMPTQTKPKTIEASNKKIINISSEIQQIVEDIKKIINNNNVNTKSTR